MSFLESIHACIHGELDKDTCDKIMLRVGIMAELDAINLYETMAEITGDDKIHDVMLDVAKEEKTHVGEFQELLKRRDKEYEDELVEGASEVRRK